MGDLRDRLEEHFRQMDELKRDRDVWRDRYLALVDQKDRHRANVTNCPCCPSCGQPRTDAIADRCGWCEPSPRCFECGHARAVHRGPSGECWEVDDGACASACGGFVPFPAVGEATRGAGDIPDWERLRDAMRGGPQPNYPHCDGGEAAREAARGEG